MCFGNKSNPDVEKVIELVKTKHKSLILNGNFRFLVFSKGSYTFVNKGHFSQHFFNGKFTASLRQDRGSILDYFSMIEFLVNELINLKITGLNSEKSFILEELLDGMDLFSKIKFLEKFKLIESKTSGLIFCTKEVRNSFAHNLGMELKQTTYKNKLLIQDFQSFKEDVETIWNKLVDSYQEELEKNDMKNLIDAIEKLT